MLLEQSATQTHLCKNGNNITIFNACNVIIVVAKSVDRRKHRQTLWFLICKVNKGKPPLTIIMNGVLTSFCQGGTKNQFLLQHKRLGKIFCCFMIYLVELVGTVIGKLLAGRESVVVL